MTEEDDNLDKAIEYAAKAIQCRMDAGETNDSLSKYALGAVARIYEEMANKEAQK